jgi:hypothetical protein
MKSGVNLIIDLTFEDALTMPGLSTSVEESGSFSARTIAVSRQIGILSERCIVGD